MKNKKIEIIKIFKWITSIHKYISIFANDSVNNGIDIFEFSSIEWAKD